MQCLHYRAKFPGMRAMTYPDGLIGVLLHNKASRNSLRHEKIIHP